MQFNAATLQYDINEEIVTGRGIARGYGRRRRDGARLKILRDRGEGGQRERRGTTGEENGTLHVGRTSKCDEAGGRWSIMPYRIVADPLQSHKARFASDGALA
ncbi:MAG: hypothetical protein EOP67_71465 [Sphingomonas sp.]|nr:MAG: hypothetical protein EOP67_71465 [Sphingomonas sp.]